ncbi:MULTISPECIES: hypothetical protein [Streptomyces]|uniref:hypothetical protein n=1 Tax=Streptomyces TaxID=1883 RepID=UPI000AD931EE|nr:MULTISPECIES: hypothetical protein [Streptomyces]
MTRGPPASAASASSSARDGGSGGVETALAAAHAASSSFMVGVGSVAPLRTPGVTGWWADMDASRGSWAGKRA